MPQVYTPLIYTLALLVEMGWPASTTNDTVMTATFAGGSFWSMEPVFEILPGVLSVTAGYTGGLDTLPNYAKVSEGKSDHVEAVQVRFNPKTVTYTKLLNAYWKNIDPTREDGQFSDLGPQFRTVIYYANAFQRQQAMDSKQRLEKQHRYGKGKRVLTEIVSATPFYPAEENHQDFYKKNAGRFKLYTKLSGRDKFLGKIWNAAPAR